MEAGTAHDCWTTTEAALTRDLAEDLLEAWARLRETAAEFGEQRIYASHSSIMFSRRSCYVFVRPRRSFLEVWIFLGRRVMAPQIRRVESNSTWKFCHLVRVQHRDQVEAPITDWMREAYEFGGKAPDRTVTARKAVAKRSRVAVKGRTTKKAKKSPDSKSAPSKASKRR